MKGAASGIFPVVLLALLAALTLWLERTASFDDPMSRAKQRHDPDFIVEDFRIVRYDAAGEVVNDLTASSMRHYPDDDSTDVSAPALFYPHEFRPLRVVAAHAWVSHDGKEVRLRDKVRLVREAAPGAPPTVLETSALTVFPDDEVAHGYVPVTITQGRSVVQGSGVEYRGKENLAVLKGRAHGTFYRVK